MKGRKTSTVLVLAVAAVAVVSLGLPMLRGELPINLGLDLSGGVVVFYRPDPVTVLPAYGDVDEITLLELAKEILSSRLQHTLHIIPNIVIRGDHRIVVSVPAEQDTKRVLEIVGRTYHLSMQRVAAVSEHEQPGEELYSYHGRFLKLDPPLFAGDMLDERSIRVWDSNDLDEPFGSQVAFRFKPPHDAAFADFTGRSVGHQLAIVLDDEVEWVGTIESAIVGEGSLRGGYSHEEAHDIAAMLRSGSLPISLEVESISAVGPSLGQETADRGLWALGLSLCLLTALVGVAYLRRGGLVVAGTASLVCLLAIIAAFTACFGLTLDLEGIAGLILSVGMGMDAFIIVFEGLEHQSSSGSTAAAVRRLYSFTGEGRALFHANATTLIVVMLLFGTERLQSFAVFMTVGIAASLTTILVTRRILAKTLGWGRTVGVDPLAWLRKAKPKVFRLRKLYFATFAAAAIAWLVLCGPGGWLPSLGPDFRAGTQLTVRGGPDVADTVTGFATSHPGVGARVQRLGSAENGRYLVTLDTVLDEHAAGTEGLSAETVMAELEQRSVTVESLTSIDSMVSSRRMMTSLAVLLLSFVVLGAYFVALQRPIDRFFLRHRATDPTIRQRLLLVAGIVTALAADVWVVMMSMSLLGIEVSLPVIAAVLTIIGYSVNDSVVLCSHLQRRWTSAAGGQGSSPLEEVTAGVDTILGRAVLTSLSTLIPAVAVLTVGLEPLADFAWVIIIGIVAGTLSSIFIVGSFVLRAMSAEVNGAGGHDSA